MSQTAIRDTISVHPSVFSVMQETANNPLLSEAEKATRLGDMLSLTAVERVAARFRAIKVVVNYNMRSDK
jgi:hypothetical protein